MFYRILKMRKVFATLRACVEVLEVLSRAADPDDVVRSIREEEAARNNCGKLHILNGGIMMTSGFNSTLRQGNVTHHGCIQIEDKDEIRLPYLKENSRWKWGTSS
ncbi:PREDICTED: uncharacterized protein LOC104819102 [Tarenaya hassleriana]|uniref:uncharacterized protein LOC104819102 n=1 Tax=Tarenaya hassleriana TaxID=28532 RepID=UPI00053C3D75|nr:PREDICTED: uncharacterized protein LOC104819102 [Tarenaya hassleriana]